MLAYSRMGRTSVVYARCLVLSKVKSKKAIY